MFDPKKFAQDAAEATPPNVAFGKLGITQSYKVFNGKGVPPTEVTRAEFDTTDLKSRTSEATFEVDGSEFNPNQKFVYSRKVRLGGRDWRKIVLPSIIAVFGSLENLRDGAYVEVEDVAQIENPDYSAPRFLRVFDSVSECADAWKARYQHKAGNGNGEIPADILTTAKSVYAAVRNENTFRTILAQDEKLSKFDVETLIAAVKA